MGVRQLLLPLVAGMVRSKQPLMEWVHQVGLRAPGEVFEHDVEQIAGLRGRHTKGRSHYRWGSTASEPPLRLRSGQRLFGLPAGIVTTRRPCCPFSTPNGTSPTPALSVPPSGKSAIDRSYEISLGHGA